MNQAKLLWCISLCILVLSAGTVGAGTWYRGDLHAHSQYSDGDSSVADMIARAEFLGLDFFTLTDHDTSLAGNPRHWYDPDYASDRMVLLYGIEWTTPHGHAKIWAANPFSYETLWQRNRIYDAQAAVAAAHEQGALFSINHPASVIFLLSWQYPVPEGVDSIEVWNSLYRLPSLNRWAGHSVWDQLLRQGRRIPGVGGSDAHMLKGWMSRFWGPGNPTTWVYAETLSAAAILAGIAAGHVSISYSPDAVRVELSADADADGIYETMAGDTITGQGYFIRFKVSLETPGGGESQKVQATTELDRILVRKLTDGSLPIANIFGAMASADMPLYLIGIFKNGYLFRTFLIMGRNGVCTFSDVADGNSYYRVEVIGNPAVAPLHHLLYGQVIAISNPIFISLE